MALEAEPDNYGLRLDYGLMLEEAGKPREAIEQLRRILPRAGVGDDPAVVFALGRAYMKLGDFSNAEEFFRRTLVVNANDRRAQKDLELIQRSKVGKE